jgi:hypothetical protein
MATSQGWRWGKRLSYLAGAIACLLFVLWVVALVVTERVDVLLELNAITEREGWRNLHLPALDAFGRREGRQRLPRGDAHMLAQSPESFVSDRHQIRISLRGSDELPG